MNFSKKAAVFAAIFAVNAALPAVAHTTIQSSNIENGAALTDAPTVFEFSFGSAVGLAALELETLSGQAVALSFDPPRGMQKDFSVSLPELASDTYVFKWRAVAKDGHVMKGEVSFTLSD